jgi:hypothetical protein
MQEGGSGHPAGGQPEPGWGQPAGGPPPGYQGPPAGPPPPAPDAAQRVATPAILLMVYAGLGVVAQLAWLLMMATGLGIQTLQRELPPDVQVNTVWNIITSVLGLLVAGGIIYGALQMKNLRNHTFAVVGAVLAFIPFINPCCCVIGLFPGGWALYVLLKNDIRAAFKG